MTRAYRNWLMFYVRGQYLCRRRFADCVLQGYVWLPLKKDVRNWIYQDKEQASPFSALACF